MIDYTEETYKQVEYTVPYSELCRVIDYLLNSGRGKKKSLEYLKKRFARYDDGME